MASKRLNRSQAIKKLALTATENEPTKKPTQHTKKHQGHPDLSQSCDLELGSQTLKMKSCPLNEFILHGFGSVLGCTVEIHI